MVKKIGIQLGVTFAVALTVVTGSNLVSAEEVAPVPVDLGQFYVGGGGGWAHLPSPTFKAHSLYPDSLPKLGWCCQVKGAVGYMIEHETDSNEFMPALHVGYALADTWGGGIFRIELAGAGTQRKVAHNVYRQPIPQNGLFVTDDGDPPVTTEVAAWADMFALDGKDNDDGSFGVGGTTPDGGPILPGWALFGPGVYENEFRFSETLVDADLTIYYDTRHNNWVFTRGAGITYRYSRNSIWNNFLVVEGDPDSFAGYDYRLVNNYIGARFLYSAGYEFFRTLSIFTTGAFSLMGVHTAFDGTQYAPGFGSFDGFSLNPANYLSGDRQYETSDWNFAYDIRLGAGASARLWFTRLTVHGGGLYRGGMPTPRDVEGYFGIATSSNWGYFANASLSLIY